MSIVSQRRPGGPLKLARHAECGQAPAGCTHHAIHTSYLHVQEAKTAASEAARASRGAGEEAARQRQQLEAAAAEKLEVQNAAAERLQAAVAELAAARQATAAEAVETSRLRDDLAGVQSELQVRFSDSCLYLCKTGLSCRWNP